MTLPYRGFALSDGVATLVDDDAAVYALVEDLTKAAWDGTAGAFVDALRVELEHRADTLRSDPSRNAIAAAVEQACAAALHRASGTAARHEAHPRPLAFLVGVLTVDCLFMVRSGPVSADVLRGDEVIELTEVNRDRRAVGLEVVTVELAADDTVVLRSSRLTGRLTPENVRSLSNDPSPRDLSTVLGDFSTTPGALGPHAIVGARVIRGRSVATVRQRDAQLRDTPIFRALGERDLRVLAPYLSVKRWFSGEQLWWDDEPADFLALIVAGRVGVVGQSGESPTGPGGTIGETALAGRDQRRVFSAVARSTVDALILQRDDFEALCARHPTLALSILRQLVAALVKETVRPG